MNNTPKKAALTKAYVSLKIRFSMAWYQRKTSSKDYELWDIQIYAPKHQTWTNLP